MTDPDQLETTPGGDAELEELVAYLDGELEPEEAERVEQRLVSDPGYRTRLQELERTWEMLDLLPESPVSESFTQTTVELVAVQAERDLQTREQQVIRKKNSLRLLFSAATLLACLAGFGVMWNWQQRDERRLLEDLPLIENLDAYRVADSVEFLEALESRGLFTETEDVRTEEVVNDTMD